MYIIICETDDQSKSKDDLFKLYSWMGLQELCFRWCCVFLSAWPLEFSPDVSLSLSRSSSPKVNGSFLKKRKKTRLVYILLFLFVMTGNVRIEAKLYRSEL